MQYQIHDIFNKDPGQRALRDLATSPDPKKREIAAQHWATSSEILESLAGDEDDRVRSAVASHPGLSSESLDRMARDAMPNVRYSVLCNPRTTLETLAKLGREARLFEAVLEEVGRRGGIFGLLGD